MSRAGSSRHAISVRDPIHGSIAVSPREVQVVESRVFQRLRRIKQLGFAEYAFPGATHSRFAHSLGAMEMATRAFDELFDADEGPLPADARRRLRQATRLAVLLHDIGHAPLSHATESRMPERALLGLEVFDDQPLRGRATHEDYTIKLLFQSELTELLRDNFVDDGIDPRDLAFLISGRDARRAATFVVDGVDYSPILRQVVSGELDADRMDYLKRDSYYAGVNYGAFDDQWLLANLTCHMVDGDRALLGLQHRAIFAFEDFLLSRYHMFVSVYYHHTPVGLDTMLARFLEEAPDAFVLPTDTEQYVELDDISFWSALRASSNRWAQRIAQRRLYTRVVELNADERLLEAPGLNAALAAAGIDYFVNRDQGVLSQYYGGGAVEAPIYVINRELGQSTRIDTYSKLFQRYAQPALLSRLYCRPDQVPAARACLAQYLPSQRELRLT